MELVTPIDSIEGVVNLRSALLVVTQRIHIPLEHVVNKPHVPRHVYMVNSLARLDATLTHVSRNKNKRLRGTELIKMEELSRINRDT